MGSPTPNFGAAPGGAAWMTSMEGNSDLIVMASYAPLRFVGWIQHRVEVLPLRPVDFWGY